MLKSHISKIKYWVQTQGIILGPPPPPVQTKSEVLRFFF